MRYCAAFAHLFGVRPWEWGLLTVTQTRVLEAEADAWAKGNRDG